ncbi:MAG: hypothetical protein JW963_17215 [Anaerolineales bacterium]|nr:hypothetical protein [Anaerolineales bacterium]
MKQNTLHLCVTVLSILMIGAACAPKQTIDPNTQIRQAVAATVAAIPTYTPYPAPTAYPPPTPMTLAGLFCEYQFCIGHPPDVAFYDVRVLTNPLAPSSYGEGYLLAFNASLTIQMLWQYAPGTADPKFLLDLIVDSELDTRVGNMDVKLIRDMNVLYTPITTTATGMLPNGGAAAWTCGERAFAWKAYTPQDGQAAALFEEAIQRFRCDQ